MDYQNKESLASIQKTYWEDYLKRTKNLIGGDDPDYGIYFTEDEISFFRSFLNTRSEADKKRFGLQEIIDKITVSIASNTTAESFDSLEECKKWFNKDDKSQSDGHSKCYKLI